MRKTSAGRTRHRAAYLAVLASRSIGRILSLPTVKLILLIITAVFLLLAAAFFGDQAPTVMMLVMLSGWVFALLVARLLRSTIIKGEATPFVMELPPYRLPTLFSVLMHCWERTWMYVKKAGTVILAISIIIWAGLTYPKLDEADSARFDTRIEQDRKSVV